MLGAGLDAHGLEGLPEHDAAGPRRGIVLLLRGELKRQVTEMAGE
jgi:hypothetical protein